MKVTNDGPWSHRIVIFRDSSNRYRIAEIDEEHRTFGLKSIADGEEMAISWRKLGKMFNAGAITIENDND